MDQHPVPRQITTFEFKLIGFMTLKQFLYLLISCPIGYIIYKIIPLPIINVLLGGIVAAIGAVFAFVPIQDRPMEVWIRNFIRRLNSPTQYVYRKHNDSLHFLNSLYFASNPHLAVVHVDTKEKLQKYLATQAQSTDNSPQIARRDKQHAHIGDLLQETKHTDPSLIKKGAVASVQNQTTPVAQESSPKVKQPYVTGVVKNRRNIALPGMLISIKDMDGKQLRLLKTNPHGIFATYSPLPDDNYQLEISDPNGNYFFDTMSIPIVANQKLPIVVYSKEIL